jgi:serine/threonine protein kinase
MAIKLTPGQKKSGAKSTYEIVRQMNNGMFASAYEAKNRSGRKVFFKEYKSPSPTIEWFEGYVAYQSELKRRIESDIDIKSRCYEFIDFFTDRFFYQVFEFIEGGLSLQECIDQFRANPTAFPWEKRVTFVRAMMFAMSSLHKAQIVHTDLKPDNLYLIPNPHVPGEYWIRLIDMDFSVLADKQAPWHGVNGYVGTPKYQSPEHIKGEIPLPASDVFTCGIMIGELLTGDHPFQHLDTDEYAEGIVSGEAHQPIKISQPIKKVEDNDFLESVINACFEPDPKKRPTAKQVADALMGKTFEWHVKRSVPHSASKRDPVVAPTKEPATSATKSVVASGKLAKKANLSQSVGLFFGDQMITQIHTDTALGKYTFKGVADEAKFLSEKQFRLFRDPDSMLWMLAHEPLATNETIVNGAKLTDAVLLEDGMTVSVGNSAKGVEKFPLTIKLL